MYHRIVGRIVRRTFVNLNAGNYQAIVAQFDPEIEHYFAGSHALSGTRHSIEAAEKWYRRLFSVFSGLRFTLRRTVIQGMPWNTNVALKVDIAAALPDGQPYSNELIMFIDIRWGRIVRINMHEDTQKLSLALAEIGAHGVPEALALPITA